MAADVSLEQRLKWRERPARVPIMYQTWTDLLFVHWEAPVEAIQATLPAGLTADTWEGRAYVGVIPFFMRNIRPRGVPPLPWVSYFLEMNVRTYVHDANGTPGVWFYSLECNQPGAVWMARALLGLPYRHAAMRARRAKDQTIHYRSRRRFGSAGAEFRYRIGAADSEAAAHASIFAAPESFEFFLVERYLLFTRHHGRLLRAQVHHSPYPLQPVTLESLNVNGLAPEGVDTGVAPVHQVGSSGVTVEVFGAEAVG